MTNTVDLYERTISRVGIEPEPMPNSPDISSHKSLLRMRIRGVGEPVFKARSRLAAAARRLAISGEDLDSVLLAFSEAVTNALIHGRSNSRKCVHVDVGTEDGRLIIEVRDHGRGFHPKSVELPPPDCMCEGGRGLYLMRVLMDEVEWLPGPSGTTVRMTKRCIPAPPLSDPSSVSSAQSAVPYPI